MSQPAALLLNEQRLNLAGQSLQLDRAELRRLLELLQERAYSAAEFEFSNPLLVGKPANEVAQLRVAICDGYGFFITVTGFDGSQLNGTVAEVFDSPNFPRDVATIFVDSATKLRNQNYAPRNSLALFVDFRRPPIFDFNLMPSHATENGSYFSARGLDATWVRGVYHEVESFVRERSITARLLHRHSVYDVLLFFLGFPLAFWAAYRVSPLIQSVGSSEFLRAGLYLYVWLLTLWLFRAAFHYARWLWPLIEYRREGSKAGVHRACWSVFCGTIFLSLTYDVLRKLIGWE